MPEVSLTFRSFATLPIPHLPPQVALSPASERAKLDNETAEEPRRTKRAALLELPLDIWFTRAPCFFRIFAVINGFILLRALAESYLSAVAEHLHPLSLLHLSQSNKTAHSFLTSKSRSARIWALSLQLIDLPQLEGNWTPMELARLVLDESCQGCGLLRAHYDPEGALFIGNLRVRCHPECLEKINW